MIEQLTPVKKLLMEHDYLLIVNVCDNIIYFDVPTKKYTIKYNLEIVNGGIIMSIEGHDPMIISINKYNIRPYLLALISYLCLRIGYDAELVQYMVNGAHSDGMTLYLGLSEEESEKESSLLMLYLASVKYGFSEQLLYIAELLDLGTDYLALEEIFSNYRQSTGE